MIYQVYYQRFWGLFRPLEIRGRSLGFTHRFVRQLEADSLGDVFYRMQGEVWSPNGEAQPLIVQLHLSHTSMSIGDVVQAPNQIYWLCNYGGWTPLDDPVQDQGPPLWLATEVEGPGAVPYMTRLKITNERDCLPADAHTVEQFRWVAFEALVELAKVMQRSRHWQVCIDLGDQYYETEATEDDD